MEQTATVIAGDRPRLTSLSHGAGCACKLGIADLLEVLGSLPVPHADELLVGTDPADDAAVWQRPDGSALVATTDFFTPVVDDPATWGAIAAANAASDVFAMGGRPLFALNVVGWPRERGLDELGEVLAGANRVATDGGWLVVGGHTIDAAEPFYGQVVIGDVAPDRMLRSDGGRAGEVLVLTKPIGTGIVMTAAKRAPRNAVAAGGELAETFAAAVHSMTTLNGEAAAVAVAHGVRAATDVTGFGLTGHLHRLASSSGVAAELDPGAVPLLPGVAALRDAGNVPGGSRRNMDFVREHIDGEVPDEVLAVIADAQTSGGLLLACPADAVDAILQALGEPAAVVGRLVEGAAGRIRIAT